MISESLAFCVPPGFPLPVVPAARKTVSLPSTFCLINRTLLLIFQVNKKGNLDRAGSFFSQFDVDDIQTAQGGG